MIIKILKNPRNTSWPPDKQETLIGLEFPVSQATENRYWISFEKAIPIIERKNEETAKYFLTNMDEADPMFPGFFIFEKEDCEIVAPDDKSVQK